jgi:hypothetical protein
VHVVHMPRPLARESRDVRFERLNREVHLSGGRGMVPRGCVPPQPISSEISAGVTVQIAIVPQPVRRAGRESLGDGRTQLDLPLVDVVRLPGAVLIARVERARVPIPT